MPTYSWSQLNDVEVGRSLLFDASKRSVTHCSREVRLALLDRARVFGCGHFILTEPGVIEALNFHQQILIS